MIAIIQELGSIVKEAMKIVTSADRAYKLIRDWGYDYSRDLVRTAWRDVGEKESWETVLNTWGPDKTPPRAWAPERKGGTRPGYMQLIKYTYRDINTGELKTEICSEVSDRPKAFGDVIEDLEDDLNEYMGFLQGQLVSVSIGGMIRLTGSRK
jgi:hypothetical protein